MTPGLRVNLNGIVQWSKKCLSFDIFKVTLLPSNNHWNSIDLLLISYSNGWKSKEIKCFDKLLSIHFIFYLKWSPIFYIN